MYGLVGTSGDLLVYDLNNQNAPTVYPLGLIDPVDLRPHAGWDESLRRARICTPASASSICSR